MLIGSLLLLSPLSVATSITLSDACEGLLVARGRELGRVTNAVMEDLARRQWIDRVTDQPRVEKARTIAALRPSAERFEELAAEAATLDRTADVLSRKLDSKFWNFYTGHWLGSGSAVRAGDELQSTEKRRREVERELEPLRADAERFQTLTRSREDLVHAHGALVRSTALGDEALARFDVFRQPFGTRPLDEIIARIDQWEAVRQNLADFERAVTPAEAARLLAANASSDRAPEEVLEILRQVRAAEGVEATHAPALTALALQHGVPWEHVVLNYRVIRSANQVFPETLIPEVTAVALRSKTTIDDVLRTFDAVTQASPGILQSSRHRPAILAAVIDGQRSTADVLKLYQDIRQTRLVSHADAVPTLVSLAIRHGLDAETIARDYHALYEALGSPENVGSVFAYKLVTGLSTDQVVAIHRYLWRRLDVEVKHIPAVMFATIGEAVAEPALLRRLQ